MCIHCGITFEQDLSDVEATSGFGFEKKFPTSTIKMFFLHFFLRLRTLLFSMLLI